MRVSLIDFLATGRLGDLDLGVSPQQVRDTLGEPDAVGGGSQRYPRPSIYLCGTVEFWFRQCRPHDLTGIYWDAKHNGEFRLRDQVSVVDWELTPRSDRAAVEALLREAAIRFERDESQPLREMVLESGVRMTFDDGGLLYAVFKGA